MKAFRTSLLLATSIALLAAPAAQAQLTGSAELGVNSRYVFRGIKRFNSNFEAAIRLDADAFYASAWALRPLEGRPWGEYNYTLGWQRPLAPSGLDRAVSLDAGITFFDYADRGKTAFDLRDTFEAYVGASTHLASNWVVSGYLYYDFRLEAWTYEASTAYAVPLGQMPASLNLSGFFGYTAADNFQSYSGRRKADSYRYYGFSAEVPWQFADRVTVTAGTQYGDNINLNGGTRVIDTTNSLWWFAKVGYKF